MKKLNENLNVIGKFKITPYCKRKINICVLKSDMDLSYSKILKDIPLKEVRLAAHEVMRINFLDECQSIRDFILKYHNKDARQEETANIVVHFVAKLERKICILSLTANFSSMSIVNLNDSKTFEFEKESNFFVIFDQKK